MLLDEDATPPAGKSVDDYVRDQPKALVKVYSSVFPRRLRGEDDLRNRVQYITPSNLTRFSNVYSLWLDQDVSPGHLYYSTRTLSLFLYKYYINKLKRYFQFTLVLLLFSVIIIFVNRKCILRLWLSIQCELQSLIKCNKYLKSYKRIPVINNIGFQFLGLITIFNSI